MAATDTATELAAQLLWLDPRELIAHTRNPRKDLGDLSELTSSIKANGVLEPLVVVPVAPIEGYDDQGAEFAYYGILAGHRRVAAAIDAERYSVPCLLRPDLAAGDDDRLGQARHIGTMVQENVLRAGLTTTEQADAVQEMLD